MTPEQIKEVLELHTAWLRNQAGGQQANLSGANLRGADLRGANLSGANLHSADLRGANLYGANLHSANLYGANLDGANLDGANLYGASLYGADLSEANLYGANLDGADLSGANLSGANLYGANLSGAKNIPAKVTSTTTITPTSGQFIGWKSCQNGVLVKLMVGKNAKRSNATGRKCRAEYVKVLEVIGAEFGTSKHDRHTEYRVGKIVRCDKWNEDRWVECGGGIHFFLTRIEAENY